MAEKRRSRFDCDHTESENPHKRPRYDSPQGTDRERQRFPPPGHLDPHHLRPDTRATTRPAFIPVDKFNAIQNVILRQHDTIRECGAGSKARHEQIDGLEQKLKTALTTADRKQDLLDRRADEIVDLRRQLEKPGIDGTRMRDDNTRELDDMKRQLRDATRKLDETTRKLEDTSLMLRQRDRTIEQTDGEDADLFLLGTKILAEKTQQATTLLEDNTKLRVLIGERDNTISALYDQVTRTATASADENGVIALETQALRTLVHIRGLQTEVAERDRAMENLQSTNADLTNANEALQAEIEGLRRNAAATDTALEAANKRKRDARAIIEDQNQLIWKLMEGQGKDK